MDLGEWEFAVRATDAKTNGLLRLEWNNEQAELINVPLMQFAGVNGQMLIEDLVNGFYVVFPGEKFQLPTKLCQIKMLKQTIKITKYIMDMYSKTNDLINSLETGYHAFDGIFKIDEPDTISPNLEPVIRGGLVDPQETNKQR